MGLQEACATWTYRHSGLGDLITKKEKGFQHEYDFSIAENNSYKPPVCICAGICTCIRTCRCVLICSCICICKSTHLYVYTCIHVVCIHTYINVHNNVVWVFFFFVLCAGTIHRMTSLIGPPQRRHSSVPSSSSTTLAESTGTVGYTWGHLGSQYLIVNHWPNLPGTAGYTWGQLGNTSLAFNVLYTPGP